MKAADVRAMTLDQIDDEVLKLKKEQFNLRFQRATGQLENTSRVRVIRRDVARLKTIAAQKRAGSMPEIAPKPKAEAEAQGCQAEGREAEIRQAEIKEAAVREEPQGWREEDCREEVEVRGSRCRNVRSRASSSATSRTRPSSCASTGVSPMRR